MRIEEHPLFKKTLEELKPLLRSIPSEDFMALFGSSEKRHRRAAKLSAEQSYHSYVFWYLVNMLRAFSRLNHVRIYIKDFPKPGSYLKQGITMYDWIQYHYHVYIVSTVGLYDIALKLTNGVFRLGLNEKIVNLSTVEDNLQVKSAGVSEVLRSLRQATSQSRGPRNLFIHGGDLLELDELAMLELICMATKHDVIREYSANSIKDLFQRDVDKLIDEMLRKASSLENNVINLFDKLLPIYNFHVSMFKSIEKTRKLH